MQNGKYERKHIDVNGRTWANCAKTTEHGMDEHEGIISFSVLEAREVGKSGDNKVTHKTEIKFCSDFASMSLSVSVSLCLCLSLSLSSLQ